MELIVLGIVVGVLSGFFGIGGGTILIPLLLFFGFFIKEAITISILQMVFSSIFGTYINAKKGSLDFKMVSLIGFGGFIGALGSGFITSFLSKNILEIIFLSFAVFALFRLFMKTEERESIRKINPFILLGIGIPIGAISMSIGVGGSIVLVPILVGFLHIELKKAISSGLFFVIFSSISGLISHILIGDIDYYSGIIVGISSLAGVYMGIQLKDKVSSVLQRYLLIVFYFLIVVYLAKRIFI